MRKEGSGKNYIIRSLLICTPHPIFFGDQMEKNKMDETRSHIGEGRGVYRVLVGKPEGKRPFGRLKHRWENNIKMDLQEVECGGMDWIELAQDREKWRELVNMVIKIQFP
jgi:hypothetical protein